MNDVVTMQRTATGVAVVRLTNGKVNALSTAVLDRLAEGPRRSPLRSIGPWTPWPVCPASSSLRSRRTPSVAVAQSLVKRAIDEALRLPLADGLALERSLLVEAFHTEDSRTGLASFLEHEPGQARFSGR